MTRPSRFVLFASSLLMAGWAVTPAGVLAAATPAAAAAISFATALRMTMAVRNLDGLTFPVTSVVKVR